MNKLNKIIIAGIAILALVIYPAIVYPYDISKKDGIINFILRVIGDLSILIFLSLIVSVILGLIPLKQKTYLNKLKTIFPIIAFIILIASSLSLLLHKTIKFDEIETPTSLNCEDLKYGNFVCQHIEIKRTLNKQIEFDSKSKDAKEYQIKWISDCEYELIGINGNVQNYKVKIIEVNLDNHKAYVSDLERNNAQLVEMKNK